MDTRFTFTKDKLDSLPLPEPGKRATYHDAKVPGLQVRVTANGAKSFSVFKRLPGGQPERVTLGKYPGLTIDQARKQALEKLHQLASGTSQKKPKAKTEVKEEIPPTLAEAVKEYVEKKKRDDGLPLKDSTRRDYLEMVRPGRPWKTKPGQSQDGELYPLAGKRIDQITGDMIRELHAKLEARCKAAAKTLDATKVPRRTVYPLIVLQAVLNWHGIIISDTPFGKNVCGKKKIVLPKADSGANPISLKCVGAWWQAVSEQDTPVSRYLRFTLLTGCRPSEPLSIIVGDCDPGNQHVTLRNTKIRDNPMLFLSVQAAAIVEQQAAGKMKDDRLFDVTPSAIKKMTRALAAITGIAFSPKSLRSTYSKIAEKLTTVYVHKNLMRHSLSGDITGKHYTPTEEDELRAGAQAIADFIEGQAATETA